MIEPNLLDKTIAWFSPKAGLKRASARQMQEVLLSYEAARPARRQGGWNTTGASGKVEQAEKNTGEEPATETEGKKATKPAKAAKPKAAKGAKGKGKKASGSTEAATAATIPDGTPGPESMQELFRI